MVDGDSVTGALIFLTIVVILGYGEVTGRETCARCLGGGEVGPSRRGRPIPGKKVHRCPRCRGQ
jgi:hypothetical protein